MNSKNKNGSRHHEPYTLDPKVRRDTHKRVLLRVARRNEEKRNGPSHHHESYTSDPTAHERVLLRQAVYDENKKKRKEISRRDFLKVAVDIGAGVIAGAAIGGAAVGFVDEYVFDETEKEKRWDEENNAWDINFGDKEIFLYAGARLRDDSIGNRSHPIPVNFDRYGQPVGQLDYPIPLDVNDVLYAGYNYDHSWYELTPEAVKKLREMGVDIKDSKRVVVNYQGINIPESLKDEIRNTEAYDRAKQ
ncbi:MAG: hypothetical protein LBQ11_01895 [Candidatus Nomurabacteria bacterium]|jgi:hypothetical protein|nr:hypothetical protein [Candidatus Nomurabacteria bacterium]